MGDAVGKRVRLTGACTRNDENRRRGLSSSPVLDRTTLFRIELRQVGSSIGHDESPFPSAKDDPRFLFCSQGRKSLVSGLADPRCDGALHKSQAELHREGKCGDDEDPKDHDICHKECRGGLDHETKPARRSDELRCNER